MAQQKALASLVKTKLSLIASQREELCGTVDSYIEKITASAKSALEAKTQDVNTISEMSFMLETVVVIMAGLSTHVDDVLSQSETKDSELTKSKEDQSHKVAATHSDTFKDHESRLSVMEDLMNQTEAKVSAKMEEMNAKIMAQVDQRLSEQDKRYTDSEKQFSTRLDNTEERLKQMGTRVDDMKEVGDSRVDKIEKRVKKMEVAGKQQTSHLDNLVKDVETLKTQHSKKQQHPKFDSLDKQVQSLTGQFSSLQDQLGDVQRLKQATDRVDTLAEKTDIIDMMKSARTMTRSIEELALRVDAVEAFVKNSVPYREKETNKRMELEDRILVVESNRSKDFAHYATKLENVESQYQQVCQIMDERVSPLRRLLRILNDLHKTVESRESISLRLDGVAKQVTDMLAQVSILDTKLQKDPVGFSACTSPSTGVQVTNGMVITQFDVPQCNEGGHFDTSTGTFTAPKEGIYMAAITLIQLGDGELAIHTWCENSSGITVCLAQTYKTSSSCCGLGVVKMKPGDKLDVKVHHVIGCCKMYVQFSCFLIG